MKKTITLLLFWILIALIPPPSGETADKWSTQDYTLEVIYEISHVLDWGQTRTIAKNPDKYYERNPILGKHPSTTKVDIYFIATALLHPIATHYLPEEYRPWWQGITITASGGCVINNFVVGIKIDLK